MIAGLVRGLVVLSLAAAIGGLVLERLLPAAAADLEIARARLRRWITTCLALLLLTTVAELVVRTQAMSGVPPVTAVAAVPQVMARTHFGQILTARVAALALALMLSFAHAAALRALALLATLAIALSLSLTGHAADWGDLTASVAVDWTHAVAAGAWTGGLMALALVVVRRGTTWSRESLAALAGRFSRLAGVCLAAVILTGSYNAGVQLGALSRLWTTTYGRVLILKLLIVAALAWLGATNRYLLIPRLGPAGAVRGLGARLFRVSRLVVLGPGRAARSATAESRLVAYIRAEAFVALAVFGCTALLGEITPGRHAAFERRGTTHVPPVTRSGAGGSRVGSVTPPAGDAARGRAVFAKLRCATCHAVPGGGFPAATRPGPDLAGIGGRHPGELVESIINPNARVLDGPGYTDERGQSIMPDYRDRLTVGELIDLVAYMQSLGGAAPPPAERPPR